jgi:hypothetical protein
MIEIIENSGRRLRLRLGGHGISTGICTLDRDSNTAEFLRLAFRIPYQRTRIACSDLRDVVVKRKTRGKTYHPMLEVRLGQDISMGGYSKNDALEAARAIRDFLQTAG